MRFRAPAKINLGLELTAKREDGYHEVISIMLAIRLADEVDIAGSSSIRSAADEVLAGCGPTDLSDAALSLFWANTNLDSGLVAQITKRIPTAAGLGGGSSDAAITLAAANWLNRNPLTDANLAAIARRIGSDVTFFLSGGCSLVSGRGEVIEKSLPVPSIWIVIVNPGVELATASVYREFTSAEFTDGSRVLQFSDSIADGHPNWNLMHNGLQAAAKRLCPQIRPILDALAKHTPHRQLSGSGPTCFGIFESRERARIAERALAADGYWTWMGLPRGPWHISDLVVE